MSGPLGEEQRENRWSLPATGTVLIVGAGEAGVAAAAALREGGFGGHVMLATDEAGIPYERPPLSKQQLKSDDEPERLIRPAEWFAAERIELIPNTCISEIDPAARRARLGDSGQVVSYDALLLATGARARRLQGDPAGVHYLRTREDAARLRSALRAARSVVVLGGGVIGLEVASTAVELGLDVTVIDPAPRLMHRAVAPEISALLADLHRAAGVTLVLESGPIAVEADGRGGALVRVGEATHSADVCVAGIGVIPNDDLARAAGCAVDNGVVVDGCGRTSLERIYAAGDVASFHHPTYGHSLRVEAWQHAGRHGAHVARSMLGIDDAYAEVPWFWTDQLETNIQVAGLAADCDQTVWRGTSISGTAFHFRNGVLRGVSTVNNGRDIRPSSRLIASGWRGDSRLLTDPTRPLGKIASDLLVEF
ncbi:FAD-dependent oxidoreductase [Sphingomonas sp. AP4-R1]|uniref:NAD(P)/FAD-dependent oxidoreductase n=1 Tax=Sphingomonas sp. AP4-R1 TaxID=2735134 RepID=UPI00149379F4|nr:FAD-dependent oxidoreductase [Sphingomonas sp. AP4-R1]QJU58184.1 FAD-dependent oxidoreductase [Sphingomonas sp. AP4-R1]